MKQTMTWAWRDEFENIEIPQCISISIAVHDIFQWYYNSIFLPYQTINEDTLLDIYYR